MSGMTASAGARVGVGVHTAGGRAGVSGGYRRTWRENVTLKTEVVNQNFLARYINGNIQKQKGIFNMHLNIRSLKNKIYEVKNLIKEHNPHIFGLSECEMNKDKVDEKSFKIPGYNIFFPTSWTQHGYARVVVYVRKSFKCEQVIELQDERVQSVWIKGGQKKSKDIFFCHGYREHLTGQGLVAQQSYLKTFLSQWEEATVHGGSSEPNEVHVCGDINIDVYQDRWLNADYSLLSLSKLIKSSCDISNFHQLVQDVTRVQFNSVTNITKMSCIDHIYTNTKFRCSAAVVTSFGDSDHDIISYTRCSKNPPKSKIQINKKSKFYKTNPKNAPHEIKIIVDDNILSNKTFK